MWGSLKWALKTEMHLSPDVQSWQMMIASRWLMANGLGLIMHTVDDWATIKELKSVKKVRFGRHRFYITGKHTDCQYRVVFMLVNKRDADDQADKKWFQDPIIKALSDPTVRVILPPPVE